MINLAPLAGRIALVTGGSRGIGRACAEELAQAGADVAINYHSNVAAAREAVEAVERLGRRAFPIQADVSQPAEVDHLVRMVEQTLGPIELLVNNAGVFDYVPHGELTLEMWQRTLNVNLTGSFLVTWAVKEGMLARRFGRIVNVASISALQPRPLSIAYAASKAGMMGLTRSTAAAFAGHNIRVNGVAPGLIETEIIEGVSAEAVDKIVSATPLQRIGHPVDVARVVRFLMTDDSEFMTGQTLVVCGGRVMTP
ncbi:MAG: SDR family NAD(P)-dependent oxidoreductase [Planctomycetaceae bacterium]